MMRPNRRSPVQRLATDWRLGWSCAFAVIAVVLMPSPSTAADPSPQGLAGLWCAKRHFGPQLPGALDVRRNGDRWSAEIAGVRVPVRADGDRLSFETAGNQGSFRGQRIGDRIVGHWIQPRQIANGTAYASPVTLREDAAGHWHG